jgi:hypothetical protein
MFSILFLKSNFIEEIKIFFIFFTSLFSLAYYRLLISKNRSSLPFSLSTFIPSSSRVAGISGCSFRLTSAIAFAGHADTQRPQPIHFSISTMALSFFISRACIGHRSSAQMPQPVQAAASIRGWNPLAAKPWDKLSLVRHVRIMQQQGQQLQIKLALSALLLLVCTSPASSA